METTHLTFLWTYLRYISFILDISLFVILVACLKILLMAASSAQLIVEHQRVTLYQITLPIIEYRIYEVFHYLHKMCSVV